MIQLRHDNKFFFVLRKMTNRQFENYWNYFITAVHR